MKYCIRTMISLIVSSILIFATTTAYAKSYAGTATIPFNNTDKYSNSFESKMPEQKVLPSLDTVPGNVIGVSVMTCDVSNRPLIPARLISIGGFSEQNRLNFAVAAAGNKILIAGGNKIYTSYGTSRVDIYDIKTNSWSTSELSQARYGMATAVLGNKIFFAGGLVNAEDGTEAYTSRVDIYDAESNIWSTAELSAPTAYSAGVTVGNKVIFASGGKAQDNFSFTAEIYDGSSGQWSTSTFAGKSGYFITGIAATSIGTKTYFAGGTSDGDFGGCSSAMYIYDVATDTWSASNLSTTNAFVGAIAVGNKNYWAGGSNCDADRIKSMVEIRDGSNETSYFDCLSRPSIYLSAVLKENKIVYVPGYQQSGTGFDIYDIAMGTWAIGVLPVNFAGSSQSISAVSVNNDIYIAGGYVNGVLSDQLWKLEIVTPPVPAALAYKYYEGDFNALPDFSTLTPVKTGNSSNVDINVRPTGVDDHFAFTWNGTITLPTTGVYTFETVSDDGSKLYFNGSLLVNNDGLHAATSSLGSTTVSAGTYPISISYFEKDGGQSMQVYWTGPGFTRQLIPDAAFGSATVPQPGNNGLTYKYYEGDFNTLPDFNALTPVKAGTSTNTDISVRPVGVDDHFAFIWQGYINLPAAGTYTFETVSDDGSKVYFNTSYSSNAGSLVNNDGLHAPASATGTINVPAAGAYPIAITYFEKDGGEIMQLYWTGPGMLHQPVPDDAFTTTANGPLAISESAGNLTSISKERIETPAMFKVYPNPFAESFTIDYYNPGSLRNKVSICIYDLSGKLVYNYEPANLTTGNNRWNIHLGASLSAGLYMAQVKINGVPAKTMKLIKTKNDRK